ncbi:hypothetical protein N1851_024572 [Merluccius polli]|uniref:Uncharacterized protein n=1 Tax=Merluccius polli TaxID=89951 RepID=A0AA47MEQ6_MERPO|nr:hypothetical protein N1851_024572 [Merluccius polli]
MLLKDQGPTTRGIQTMRQEMLDSLNRRFAKVEDVPCVVLATLLDPRYKHHAFTSDHTLTKAKEWLIEEMQDMGEPSETEVQMSGQTEAQETEV